MDPGASPGVTSEERATSKLGSDPVFLSLRAKRGKLGSDPVFSVIASEARQSLDRFVPRDDGELEIGQLS
jgi:hypothetical protein